MSNSIKHKFLLLDNLRDPPQKVILLILTSLCILTYAPLAITQSVRTSIGSMEDLLQLYEMNADSIRNIQGAFDFRIETYNSNEGKWHDTERSSGLFTSEGLKHRFDIVAARSVAVGDKPETNRNRDFVAIRIITPEKDLEWAKNRRMVTINPSDDGRYEGLILRLPHGGPYLIPPGKMRDNILSKLSQEQTVFKDSVYDGKSSILMIQSSTHPTISSARLEKRSWLMPEFNYFPAAQESYIVFPDSEYLIASVNREYSRESGPILVTNSVTVGYTLAGNSTPQNKEDFEAGELVPVYRISSSFKDFSLNTVLSEALFKPEFPSDVTIIDKITGITLPPSERTETEKIGDAAIDEMVSTAIELKNEPTLPAHNVETHGTLIPDRNNTVIIFIALTSFGIIAAMVATVIISRRKKKDV